MVDRPQARRVPLEGMAHLTKKRLPAFRHTLTREVARALAAHGRWWYGRMLGRFRAPLVPYGSANNNIVLHNRTGFLRGSLFDRVEGKTSLKGMRLQVGSRSPYAATQEYGGKLRARRKKFMAIPMDDNLTPAGVPKISSPSLLRNDPNVRFVVLPSGGLFLVRDALGAGPLGFQRTNTEFLFAFRKEVDIPGPQSTRRRMPSRLGIRDTALGDESVRLLRERLKGSVTAAAKAAGGSVRG